MSEHPSCVRIYATAWAWNRLEPDDVDPAARAAGDEFFRRARSANGRAFHHHHRERWWPAFAIAEGYPVAVNTGMQQVGTNHYRVPGDVPIDVFANEPILRTFDDAVFQQASNTAAIPGVESVVLMPDAHSGYGAPIGAVVATKNTLIPMVAGYDISCGMSFLQTSLQVEQLADWRIRRGVIQAIERRVPPGRGQGRNPGTENPLGPSPPGGGPGDAARNPAPPHAAQFQSQGQL